MASYKSIVAYDGTDFEGFQRQAEGKRTVQTVLEDALRVMGWQGTSILAAGRTDKGVHARGQVIAYELDWHHGPELLDLAWNAHLPRDVAVRGTVPAPDGFHPRFSARRRAYRYSLLCSRQRDPLRERQTWWMWPAPAIERLQAAAAVLVGAHDFGAFGRPPIPGGHTRRHVFRAVWSANGEELGFEIEADAFLYRMVRRLVACMVEVGVGRMEVEAVQAHLDQPANTWMGKVAPARGLCLEAVKYEDASPGEGDQAGEEN
jgi:tRNA pseudouridine38-40 synthase